MIYLAVSDNATDDLLNSVVLNDNTFNPSSAYTSPLVAQWDKPMKLKATQTMTPFLGVSQREFSASLLVDGLPITDASFGGAAIHKEIQNNAYATASADLSYNDSTGEFSVSYTGTGIAFVNIATKLSGNMSLVPFFAGAEMQLTGYTFPGTDNAGTPWTRPFFLFSMRNSFDGNRTNEIGTRYQPLGGTEDAILINRFLSGSFVSQAGLHGPPMIDSSDVLRLKTYLDKHEIYLNGTLLETRPYWVKYVLYSVQTGDNVTGAISDEGELASESEVVCDFSGLPSGTYYLKAIYSDGSYASQLVTLTKPSVLVNLGSCVLADFNQDDLVYNPQVISYSVENYDSPLTIDSIAITTPNTNIITDYDDTTLTVEGALSAVGTPIEFVFVEGITIEATVVACSQSYETPMDTPIDVDVSIYDDNINGYANPSGLNGDAEATDASAGLFTYTPASGFTGTGGFHVDKLSPDSTSLGRFFVPVEVIPPGSVCDRTIQLPAGASPADFDFGWSHTNSAGSVTNWQDSATFTGLADGTYYFFARPKSNTACVSAGYEQAVTGCS